MTWLPPDQTPTRKWPIVGERAPAAEAPRPEDWTLTVAGLVEIPRTYTIAELVRRGGRTLVTDVHCVTRWSHQGMAFAGLPLADLLAEVRPAQGASYVRFVSWSARAHDTGLPLEVAARDTWVVHAPLTVEHGHPLRTVTVGRYFYKSLKWLRAIELLDAPVLGYWEREDGYHENADPRPGTERYVSGSITPEQLARFRAATDFGPYLGRTLRGLDLRGWRPSTSDLRGLRLKDCDFTGARLENTDLRGANLTMGHLRGADLRNADLREADLEGAWLAGADLRGADLRGSFLTGTTFFEGDVFARVEGARLGGASGLLEIMAAWLATQPLAERP